MIICYKYVAANTEKIKEILGFVRMMMFPVESEKWCCRCTRNDTLQSWSRMVTCTKKNYKDKQGNRNPIL